VPAVGTPEYNDKLKQVIDSLKQEEGVSSVFSVLDASKGIGAGLVRVEKVAELAVEFLHALLGGLVDHLALRGRLHGLRRKRGT